MSSKSLQELLRYNSRISNRILSLTKQQWPEDLAKQMAEQGLYFKDSYNLRNGFILCYVCGLVFDKPKKTKKSLDAFCQAHKNKALCWIPKVIAMYPSASFYMNWPIIWISPIDVIKSGFSFNDDDDGELCKCHTCHASIESWGFPLSTTMDLLKTLHNPNCTAYLPV